MYNGVLACLLIGIFFIFSQFSTAAIQSHELKYLKDGYVVQKSIEGTSK